MKKIILIEDNQDVRETTADILELANYDVSTAENGKEGIRKVIEVQPDLIICDIMMPGLDGYGVLHILSKKPETARIPFIFLTAKAEKTDIRRGMNLGADDYLTKPFEEMELLNAVESRLKKNEMMQSESQTSLGGIEAIYSEAGTLEELKTLSKERKIRTYKKKRILFQEGNKTETIFFVNKGKVKTYKTTEDGKEFITSIYQEGEFFGYMPLLSSKETYTETAITMEESELCLIPKSDFYQLIHYNHKIANKFIKMLSNNLLEREEQLLQVSYHSVRQRVAEALLKLNEKAPYDEGIAISREDLAGLIGTVKETVIRTLADFKDEGLIAIERKFIRILSTEGLMRVKM